MDGIRKVIRFTLKYVNFDTARNVADGILIALMKHTDLTYTSSITIPRWWKFGNPNQMDDIQRIPRTITIYQCKGNRGSILSPSQNELMKAVIATYDASYTAETMETLQKLDKKDGA